MLSLLREMGLVLVLACAMGWSTYETVETASRCWERLGVVINILSGRGEQHDHDEGPAGDPEA
jgi:hypothetical protein